MRTGCSANSVDAYVHELRVGTDMRGETPYGGALEIELFVRVWEGYCVNVWAAPGDVLAQGRNEYRLVAVYGDGSQVVDLRLSNSGTWAAHYELIHPQVHKTEVDVPGHPEDPILECDGCPGTPPR